MNEPKSVLGRIILSTIRTRCNAIITPAERDQIAEQVTPDSTFDIATAVLGYKGIDSPNTNWSIVAILSYLDKEPELARTLSTGTYAEVVASLATSQLFLVTAVTSPVLAAQAMHTVIDATDSSDTVNQAVVTVEGGITRKLI